MSLHPTATHWFETYVPREQTVYALEALIGTGKVELEKDYVERPVLDTPALRDSIARAHALVARHPPLTGAPARHNAIVTANPEQCAQAALATLRRHVATQLRLQRRQRDITVRLHRLRMLQRCIDAMGEAATDLLQYRGGGDFLCHLAFACPIDLAVADFEQLPGIGTSYADAAYRYCTVFCLPGERHEHASAFDAAGCERIVIPGWLVDCWPERVQRMQQETERLQVMGRENDEQLARLGSDPACAAALGDLYHLDWFLQRTVLLSEDHKHCYVTGWTTAQDPAELQQALDTAGIDAKLLFRPMPPGSPAPIGLADGVLLRPFQQFVRMFGAPGPGEIDPTPLVAVLVPLLFGFMFADLGHGLALVAASLVLWRRHAQTRFLLTCGLSAAAFGLLFGEAFGLQAPLPAVLPSPLDEPLDVLLASMLFGALLLLLGLALSAVEAKWRGELRDWLWLDGAVLVLYASAMLAVVYPPALAVTALALGWYLVGIAVTGRKPGQQLGRLAQSTLELALNTLSFARVGAFAVAHTALSHTVNDITGQIDHVAVGVVTFALGHALIIVLEGLVVFVQTTRLIFFEFFTRFLRADGRLFRALAPSTRDDG